MGLKWAMCGYEGYSRRLETNICGWIFLVKNQSDQRCNRAFEGLVSIRVFTQQP